MVNCNFLSRKIFKNFSYIFFFNFWSSIKTMDPDPDSIEMLDPDPYPEPDSRNPDPKL
jgi:hypothetical protein